MRKDKGRKSFLWLIMFVFTVCVLEFLCFVTFTVFKDKLTFYDFDKYLLYESQIDHMRKYYSRERGWRNKYSTKFGERRRTKTYNKPFISVFGDSYVYCQGVEHHETWEAHLADFLKKDVYNFGVIGYGTDQAYITFLSEYPKLKTPIAILGVMPENLNRIVNMYKPFYFEHTGVRFTKPRFILKNSELTLLENPVRSADEITKLADPEFVRKIGKNDFWYSYDNYPELKFPYLRILFNRRLRKEIMQGKDAAAAGDRQPRRYVNLWHDKMATKLMMHILKEFVNKTKELNGIPVIMIVPSEYHVYERYKSANKLIEQDVMAQFCLENKVLMADSIEFLAKRARNTDDIKELFAGHLSPKGNKVVASYLHQFINKIELPKSDK